MSLATAAPTASFDQAAGEFLDLSNELASIIRSDNTALLSRISMGEAAIETSHYWMEDQLNPNTAAESGTGIDGSTTSMSVVAGQGVRFKIGTLFKDNTAGKTEVMQVTAVSTDALTIVRGYGSTTGETHAASFPILIIAHTNQESQDAPADESRIRTKVGNYTQIYSRGVNISYTLRAVKQAGVADEFAYQTAQRMKEIMREMDNTLINGIKSADAGSDTSYRSSAGMIEMTSQVGGNYSTTSEALSPSVVNAGVKLIWDDGGEPDFILVGGKQKRAISAFDQAYRRKEYNSTDAGYVVDKFTSDLGYVLNVWVDPWMPDDTMIIGQSSRVKYMNLQNDAMRAEELAKTGRSWKAQVTGQYTMEVRNAKEAFFFHNSLS